MPYVLIGNIAIPGPPGTDGTDGTDGSPGGPGQAGAILPGLDGDQGDEGFPIPGPRGDTGPTGISLTTTTIIPGFDGQDGEDAMPIPGNAGVPGPTGAPGVGTMGMPGRDGDEGEMGFPIPGNTGAAGATGTNAPLVPGWDGEDGAEGMAIPGNTGATGGSGGPGPAGLTIPGWDGEDGAEGMPVPGNPGSNGTIGRDGAGGPPGIDGEGNDEIIMLGAGRQQSTIAEVTALSTSLTNLSNEINTKQDMIEFQDEGNPLGGPGDITSVNFTGEGVNVTQPTFGNLVVSIPRQYGAVSILEDNGSEDGFPVPGPQGIQGIQGIPGGGGGGSATTVETNVGTTPIAGGRFTITDAAITPSSKVIVTQAPGAYTGKGTRGDEAEMDPIICVAAPGSGSAIVYWRTVAGYAPTQEFEATPLAVASVLATGADYIGRNRAYRMRTIGRVKGNIKFTYQVFA